MPSHRLLLTWIAVWPLMLATATAEDWPNFRGPMGTGISRETAWSSDWPKDGPARLWSSNVGTGYSSVAVVDDKLYTIGNEDNRDTVVCLDAATGKKIWSHSYDSPLDARFFEGGPTSTPTVNGTHVYTIARQGDVFCLDRRNGKVIWATKLSTTAKVRVPGWGFAGSPVVMGGLLLFNAGSGGVALEKANGKLAWASADRDAGYTTPQLATINSKRLCVFTSNKYVVGADPNTGKQLWQFRWLTRFGCNAADPIVSDNKIFVSSGYNRGSALLDVTKTEPTTIWKTKELQNHFSSSILHDKHLYGIDGNNDSPVHLKCVELSTGRVIWKQPLMAMANMILAGDRLILLLEDGKLEVGRISKAKYTPLATTKLSAGPYWTSPVLAHGRIYCRNAHGNLTCLDVRAPETSPR